MVRRPVLRTEMCSNPDGNSQLIQASYRHKLQHGKLEFLHDFVCDRPVVERQIADISSSHMSGMPIRMWLFDFDALVFALFSFSFVPYYRSHSAIVNVPCCRQ